jgi:hypothetical protein
MVTERINPNITDYDEVERTHESVQRGQLTNMGLVKANREKEGSAVLAACSPRCHVSQRGICARGEVHIRVVARCHGSPPAVFDLESIVIPKAPGGGAGRTATVVWQ